MSTIIGIDPGKSGGIAVIKDGQAWADKMPETCGDIADYLKDPVNSRDAFVFLEQANPSGDPNARGIRGRTILYGNYCYLEMALHLLNLPTEVISSMKWQKYMGCYGKCRDYADKKRYNKQKAQQLFPSLKVTNFTADALLIAEYGRRARNGQ